MLRKRPNPSLTYQHVCAPLCKSKREATALKEFSDPDDIPGTLKCYNLVYIFIVTYKEIPIFKPTNAHMYYVQGMQGKWVAEPHLFWLENSSKPDTSYGYLL